MVPRRFQRRRAPLLGAGLLLLLVAVAIRVALLTPPAVAAVPLDPNLPNEQGLIAAGLSGTPGRGQPTGPIAVDRVLVDGAATYVQYHTAAPAGSQGDPLPTLSDDRGVPIAGDVHSGVTFSSGWAIPLPLPSWLPWHPQTVRHGVVVLPPLPPTARAAVLRFGGAGTPSGPGGGETVRVPLDLRPLARRHVAHPGTTARAAGLTLTVRELAFSHLSYTYVPPPGAPSGFGGPSSAVLADAAGRPVPAVMLDSECASNSIGQPGMRCDARLVFPPQHAGAHLTLTISAFWIYGARGGQRLLRGPWRLPFVVP